ncbi:MAG: hypothetical protein HY764_03320 [Candidatus Portnoybacteria bacterium]|nr:hypothetical protein [Candidatus Portnoybacteria bacterium]
MSFESSKENIKESEKEIKWRQAEQEIEGIGDKRRKGIDEGIKFTVVSLRVNGFGTTASCEGHLDRGLPWPWVDVESKLAESLIGSPHYNELREKAGSMLRREGKMIEEEKSEYQSLVSAQIEENEKEYRRLSGLLEEFYGQESQKKEEGLVGVAHLKIKKFPWNQSRLQPEDVPENLMPREA